MSITATYVTWLLWKRGGVRTLCSVTEEKCVRAQDVLKTNVRGALDTLTRRWTGEILIAGDHGARRFSEYRRAIAGVSDRMLTLRLRELERLGLISRTVEPSTRVKVMYAPTAHGIELLELIRSFLAWGEQDTTKVAAPR
jgi:DNA-binding HxlR family transcriptional regulator